MGAAYSQDLRNRVLGAYDRGMRTKQIADVFCVFKAWARRVKQRRREFGETTPRRVGSPGGGGKIDRARLAQLIGKLSDTAAAELMAKLNVQCSDSAIYEALRKMGYTFNKKMIHAAEQDRPDVAQRRLAWRHGQSGLDAGRLIFIDETWAKTNMTRLRGRALRGQRLFAKVPHGHWITTTLIAALDVEGVRCSTVVDGAVNGDVFEAFVEQTLIHKLRKGDVVIMDNLSSHKRASTRSLIESAGAALIFLPPYSPDLNPIEMIFSKVKQLLRSLACRTREALWGAMQFVLDQVTASDTANCFRNYGYTLRNG